MTYVQVRMFKDDEQNVWIAQTDRDWNGNREVISQHVHRNYTAARARAARDAAAEANRVRAEGRPVNLSK